MSARVITKAGFCLPGFSQPLYNKTSQKKVIVSPNYWELKDKPFDGIKPLLAGQISQPNKRSHILKELTPVSNQGNIGSCVANAWCDALEILRGLQNMPVVQLSRLFLYWTARSLTGDHKKDQGCYIRAAAQQLSTIGVVEEQYYPYEEKNVLTSPPLDMFTMASNHRFKIHSYYKIISSGKERVNDVTTAIMANHPVVFCTQVGQELFDYRDENITLTYPKNPEGGHAMIIVGVDSAASEKHFYVRNSWSEKWGDKGHFWMDEKWLTHSNTYDIWVPVAYDV